MPKTCETKLKIYLVVGLGYVIGEQVHDWKEKIVLQNAGVVKGDGKHIAVTPPVLHWFAHQMDKIQRFEIPKRLIINDDDASPDLYAVYDMYIKKLTEKTTGIKVANEQDMQRVINIAQKKLH